MARKDTATVDPAAELDRLYDEHNATAARLAELQAAAAQLDAQPRPQNNSLFGVIARQRQDQRARLDDDIAAARADLQRIEQAAAAANRAKVEAEMRPKLVNARKLLWAMADVCAEIERDPFNRKLWDKLTPLKEQYFAIIQPYARLNVLPSIYPRRFAALPNTLAAWVEWKVWATFNPTSGNGPGYAHYRNKTIAGAFGLNLSEHPRPK